MSVLGLMIRARSLLFFLSLVILLPGCGGQGFLQPTSIESSEAEVGTTVGNPVPIKKLGITFSLDETPETTLADDEKSDPHCRHLPPKKNHAGAKRCHATPAKLEMGVLGVSLASCRDQSGIEIICDDATAIQIEDQAELHQGQLLALSLDGGETSFDLNQAPMSESISVGGMRLTTAYIGYTLPDLQTDPTGAALFDPALQGITFRVCLSPDDKLSADEMTAYCGSAHSKKGDLLFDLNRDGVFGFVGGDENTGLTENTARPENYFYSILKDLRETYRRHAATYTDALFSGTDQNGNSGFLSQLLPFDSVTALNLSEVAGFSVTYDVTSTIKFVDEKNSSEGYYSPLSDGALQIAPPRSTSLMVK